VDYRLNVNSAGEENTCWTAPSGGYNGDGDRNLDDYSDANLAYYNGEVLNFFLHLSNAGLIDQQLNRTSSTGCNTTHYEGSAFPEIPIKGGMIVVQSNGKYHYLLGTGETRSHSISNGGEFDEFGIGRNRLSTRDSAQIDEKIYDGKPLRGKINVVVSYSNVNTGSPQNYGVLVKDGNDNDTNCVYNSDYNKGYNEKACTLSINIGR
jgi:hypothetical protein